MIPTEVDRERRFIEGLHYGIKITMSTEAEIGTTFLQFADIACRIERIQSQSRETIMARARAPIFWWF